MTCEIDTLGVAVTGFLAFGIPFAILAYYWGKSRGKQPPSDGLWDFVEPPPKKRKYTKRNGKENRKKDTGKKAR